MKMKIGWVKMRANRWKIKRVPRLGKKHKRPKRKWTKQEAWAE